MIKTAEKKKDHRFLPPAERGGGRDGGTAGGAGHRLRRFAAMALVCLLALAFLPFKGIAAQEEMSEEDKRAIARAQAQMEDVARQAEAFAKEQDRLSAQQDTVLGEMKTLSGQIAVLEREIKDLDAQIADKESNITALTGNIEVKTAEVAERTGYLDQRLNQIYTDGDLSVLDVLFESASLTDFLTRYDLMEKVVENDTGLLTELRTAKAELETEKAVLEEAKVVLEADRKVQQDKKSTLDVQWNKQNTMSRNLAADLELAEQAEDELAAQSKELEKFVAQVQAKYAASYMGSGTFGWPVPGRTAISSPYGYRIHPIYGTRKFHTGIDIPAPSGTAVVASDTGVVIMAANYGGFGKTVILDHGGGVASQYSHLSSIAVSMGQTVAKGAGVGGVGTTGLSTGNHLHYQIMIDGKTVDPLNNGRYFVSP